MALSNRERIDKALLAFTEGTAPYVEAQMEAKHGDDWQDRVASVLSENRATKNKVKDGRFVGPWDVTTIDTVLQGEWQYNFRQKLDKSHRSLLFELKAVRDKHAHQEPFSTDDTLRALDSIQRFLNAISAGDKHSEVEVLRTDLLRTKFAELQRVEQKRAKRSALSGTPLAGLSPWRNVIAPHPDVASGRFAVARFAADLASVHRGDADSEYSDPKEFYRRTHLTEGLQSLLITVLERISGGTGNPIVELKTNFGGGKTHSMLAAYHLCSDVPLEDLIGVSALLQKSGVPSLPEVKRAVLVGTDISASQPSKKDDGTEVRTLWGELGWQLAGREGYERFRLSDETGASPGAADIADFLKDVGPCLILIDEWVAFVRQMFENKNQLSGGTFGSNMTFAQSLCEAIKRCPQAMMLATLPQSQIELGGDGGKEALAQLQDVFKRIATHWTPATKDESFEIVRRRLFEPITSKSFASRDAVVSAFAKMYRDNRSTYPSEACDGGYADLLAAAYPIHPELFARLYADWSSIDEFQRTRGVLRLMAKVIHRLCMDDDKSLMIMPSSVPLDVSEVKDELTGYLPPVWKPILDSDVDGESSAPYRLDKENPNFQKNSAARRVARTIFMGSAPIAETANRGVGDKQIKLGCIQAGESSAVFGDAVRQLSERCTHLYGDGAKSWYSTQPNVNREAQQLSASIDMDYVLEEIRRRLRSDASRGAFARVHACPESSADVPDEMDSKLVILGPEHTHTKQSNSSSAFSMAEEILTNRGSSPRHNRNAIIFLSCDEARLNPVLEAARSYLAWARIYQEKEQRNLDAHNETQAKSRQQESDTNVNHRIAEAWRWLLVPDQPDASNPNIEWIHLPMSGGANIQDSISIRASKKLEREGQLLTTMAPVILLRFLDKILWNDNETKHLDVRTLSEWFSQYLYLPRLATSNVLTDSIIDGLSKLTWENDGFGYADQFDEDNDRYIGLVAGGLMHSGAQIRLDGLSVLVKAEVTKAQFGAESEVVDDGTVDPGVQGGGTTNPGGGVTVTTTATVKATHFNAKVKLNADRPLPEAEKIVDNVIQHLSGTLGAEVELTLTIAAKHKDGFNENVKRAVLENCNTLSFDSHEFHEG